ncbi:aldolase [Variovorax sp. dw_954]|uniref:aldolase n=1 Tax=Variovorax sp. dw_954 TaxID=2720078 RepID=UPI001BD21F8D|nr:aldolase [Variovorax sp. dw_954]
MEKTLALNSILADDNKAQPPSGVLVEAARILAHQGHAVGLAGQITLRDGDSCRFWTLALGVGLEEATAADVLRLDEGLNILEGRGRPNPGVRFHGWIYRNHPSVKAIVHTHPPATSALSMLGIPMPVAHMDAAMFHEDCGFLAHWPGVPTGDDEGMLISQALGNKRSAMLVNHGVVCTGASLQEAVYLNVFAERNARMVLDAMAAGSLKPVEPAAAREAHDFLLQPSIVEATFAYWARQASRRA